MPEPDFDLGRRGGCTIGPLFAFYWILLILIVGLAACQMPLK